MILGDYQGYIHYFENTSSSMSQLNLILSIPQMQDENANTIDVGHAAKPTLFDLNSDGDLDLIIGEENGNLNYYENIGSTSNMIFRLQSETFGNIDVSTWWSTFGNSIPQFFRDNQNNLNLFVGSKKGVVFHYNNIENNLNGTFNVVDTNVSNLYTNTDLYFSFPDYPNSSPAIGNLNNDSLPDMILGNERGGLTLFFGNNDSISTSIKSDYTNSKVEIFPNPSQNYITIKGLSQFNYLIYNSIGKIIKTGYSNNNTVLINSLKNGIYILKIESDFNTFTKQFIKL